MNKIKRQPADWKNIFANVLQTRFISKIHRQLIQLNNKKKKQTSNQKMGRRLKQAFLQRKYTDGQQAHEKVLNNVNYEGNTSQS